VEVRRLEKESAKPDFWAEQVKAQGTMRRLAEQKKAVEQWRGLEKRVADLTELAHLTGEDEALQLEI
jgi:peptide chain release factor 2